MPLEDLQRQEIEHLKQEHGKQLLELQKKQEREIAKLEEEQKRQLAELQIKHQDEVNKQNSQRRNSILNSVMAIYKIIDRKESPPSFSSVQIRFESREMLDDAVKLFENEFLHSNLELSVINEDHFIVQVDTIPHTSLQSAAEKDQHPGMIILQALKELVELPVKKETFCDQRYKPLAKDQVSFIITTIKNNNETNDKLAKKNKNDKKERIVLKDLVTICCILDTRVPPTIFQGVYLQFTNSKTAQKAIDQFEQLSSQIELTHGDQTNVLNVDPIIGTELMQKCVENANRPGKIIFNALRKLIKTVNIERVFYDQNNKRLSLEQIPSDLLQACFPGFFNKKKPKAILEGLSDVSLIVKNLNIVKLCLFFRDNNSANAAFEQLQKISATSKILGFMIDPNNKNIIKVGAIPNSPFYKEFKSSNEGGILLLNALKNFMEIEEKNTQYRNDKNEILSEEDVVMIKGLSSDTTAATGPVSGK